MAKGTEAKNKVIERIKQVFGQDYIGEYEKKIFLWSEEDGEKVQVSISLTCPKNPVGIVNAAATSPGLNFEDDSSNTVAPATFQPAEVTDEERENIIALMERLNL